jgi:hypothetical protein
MSPGVRAWRARNPGYWRKRRVALQDLSLEQAIDSTNKKANFVSPPLQEILSAQPAVLIGLIAHITGTPHQEEIARTTDRLLRLGQDILATSGLEMAMTEPDSGGTVVIAYETFCKIHDCPKA